MGSLLTAQKHSHEGQAFSDHRILPLSDSHLYLYTGGIEAYLDIVLGCKKGKGALGSNLNDQLYDFWANVNWLVGLAPLGNCPPSLIRYTYI